MLTQLLTDVKALAEGLPAMQTALDAVQIDVAGGGKIDTKQLAADAAALSTAAEAVVEAIANVQADLSTLPQATAPHEAMQDIIGEMEKDGVSLTPQQLCRLATFAVLGLEFAGAFGLAIPPQVLQLAIQAQTAACSAPAPTPPNP